MAARASSRSPFLPDICVTRFQYLFTSRQRVGGQLVLVRDLRFFHPEQE